MTRFIPAQSPGPAKASQVPRAPLPVTGVTSYAVASCTTSESITPPSWLMRRTKTLPPTSVVPNTTGLCRLSSVPAGSWPFPTLSLQSLRNGDIIIPYLSSSQQSISDCQESFHRFRQGEHPQFLTKTWHKCSLYRFFSRAQKL